MARPREPSRSAAAGAGGASTAGWSRPARAHRRPRGPTREYRSAAERGGRDRDRDPDRLSALPRRIRVLLSRAQPGSRALTGHGPSPTAGLGERERGHPARTSGLNP